MILVAGATGFVGNHTTRILTGNGLQVRVLARNLSELKRISDLKVDVVQGDVTDPASLEGKLEGITAVVHLVGIIRETASATFEGVHVNGTRNLVEAAVRSGVERFIYISALGTRKGARSMYHRTKWQAERTVVESGLRYVILRPSVMFGPDDAFFNMLRPMVKWLPVTLVADSGEYRLQPIWVQDTATCIKQCLADENATDQIIEIGGPQQLTFNQVIDVIAEVLGVRRPRVHLPLGLMRPAAKLMERILPNPPLTTDQLLMLQEDNVCDLARMRELFDIELMTLEKGLKSYW